ncbi:uncharacterized protein A4U43_C05F6100 [Asparagus officinalis]|uniref:NAC domain-containing protein n=1 Tax=Asparagus officinalis TaxID=4686 RepID=A0A5P1EPP9_ASPOF|nr:NAC domain-containing protein 79-like [Asparagus officinalis]ONK67995.1 uncharacterized protein A4U43_C05F6100 [Asparagus officinalis]
MDERLYLPPGFRFHPTDEEIITHYLSPKFLNPSFSSVAIGDVDLNKSEPWDLPSKAKMGEKEWYFFWQRDRKYPTGTRTNRATEAGYWKATGKDKEIFKGRGVLVGMKKTLVFYRGRAPRGEKSNWVMHEYRLEGKIPFNNLPKPSKEEWVVCRVFHKNAAAKKTPIMPEFARRNSFAHLVDYSSNLPPLMDSTTYNFNYKDDSDVFDFKGILTNTAPMNNSSANNYFAGFNDLSTNFSSLNQVSMVSDDTGLSTERNTEISSRHEEEDIDLDNMWKC